MGDITRTIDMRADGSRAGTVFGGRFNSDGGSQFMRNNFITNGAPIYFDSSSDNRLPASICELPDAILSSHFTGRVDELQQIDRAFSASSGNLPARCVIHGMPGVGKTQLALRYAMLGSERSKDMYTFWVSAASVEKLARDFSKLVDLCLPGRHALDQATKLTLARAWLEDPTDGKKWLLVLDNVTQETSRMILNEILPRRNSGGRLLFTTRTASIAESCTTSSKSLTIALQPPRLHDAVNMLAAGVGRGGEDAEDARYANLECLVRSVGHLPLAIDQAASYLKESGSSTKELLDLYQSEEIMEVLSWENDLSRHEEKSVVTTFLPALNRVSQTAPDAVTLLRIFCFCDPENIPISILEQGCGALSEEGERVKPTESAANARGAVIDLFRSPIRLTKAIQKILKQGRGALSQENEQVIPTASAANARGAVIDLFRSPIRLSKAIQEIQRLSLAVYTSEGSERTVRVHDLVQLLLRSKLIAAAEREQWLKLAICIVCKAFEGIGDRRSPRNWSRCSQFISHIEFMGAFAAQYGLRDANLLDANAWGAIYFDECGLYQKAASVHKQTWDRRKAVLGEKNPDTLTSMANLASTYGHQGRWKEAEELEVRVMETSKRVLGEEDPDTLISIGNLASTYRRQERWKEAEELEVRVMETRKRVLGEEHLETLTSMANLAVTYSNQGRWKEAEELQMQAMETRKRVLGEEHPDTLNSMNNLASTFNSQSRYKEAISLMNRCLELQQQVLGPKHPNTLISMSNLALTLKSQNRNEEAFSLVKKCLKLRNQVLGWKHPDTKKSLDMLHDWQDSEDKP